MAIWRFFTLSTLFIAASIQAKNLTVLENQLNVAKITGVTSEGVFYSTQEKNDYPYHNVVNFDGTKKNNLKDGKSIQSIVVKNRQALLDNDKESGDTYSYQKDLYDNSTREEILSQKDSTDSRSFNGKSWYFAARTQLYYQTLEPLGTPELLVEVDRDSLIYLRKLSHSMVFAQLTDKGFVSIGQHGEVKGKTSLYTSKNPEAVEIQFVTEIDNYLLFSEYSKSASEHKWINMKTGKVLDFQHDCRWLSLRDDVFKSASHAILNCRDDEKSEILAVRSPESKPVVLGNSYDISLKKNYSSICAKNRQELLLDCLDDSSEVYTSSSNHLKKNEIGLFLIERDSKTIKYFDYKNWKLHDTPLSEKFFDYSESQLVSFTENASFAFAFLEHIYYFDSVKGKFKEILCSGESCGYVDSIKIADQYLYLSNEETRSLSSVDLDSGETSTRKNVLSAEKFFKSNKEFLAQIGVLYKINAALDMVLVRGVSCPIAGAVLPVGGNDRYLTYQCVDNKFCVYDGKSKSDQCFERSKHESTVYDKKTNSLYFLTDTEADGGSDLVRLQL